MLDTLAIVLERPGELALKRLDLPTPGEHDMILRTRWSGISTGTERLLYSGRMPAFPGMGYPLVPGYETVGEVVEAPKRAGLCVGQTVFVPGAQCFGAVRGLFGGAASRLVAPVSRAVPVAESLGEKAILFALAATAFHARADADAAGAQLIVGHGVLGRLLARLIVSEGGEPPVVWERNPARIGGAVGYQVLDSEKDARRDYRTIFDVSGDASILDTLIARLARGGEIVLAGFYDVPIAFAFPPAFTREARIRVAAEWRAPDLAAVARLVEDGTLSLDGLISHVRSSQDASTAYPTAFNDPSCLKMVLDWRACS
jgi:3-hydroxyethyl bacteriochlorophyllide a dehydrogenase